MDALTLVAVVFAAVLVLAVAAALTTVVVRLVRIGGRLAETHTALQGAARASAVLADHLGGTNPEKTPSGARSPA